MGVSVSNTRHAVANVSNEREEKRMRPAQAGPKFAVVWCRFVATGRDCTPMLILMVDVPQHHYYSHQGTVNTMIGGRQSGGQASEGATRRGNRKEAGHRQKDVHPYSLASLPSSNPGAAD